jgi:hypothetical protein
MSCADKTTLPDVFSCIVENMPRTGHFNESRPYIRPNESHVYEWRTIIDKMLTITTISHCEALTQSLILLRNFYMIRSFIHENTQYCLLVEKNSANINLILGWGTFIVKMNSKSTTKLDLHLSAAHPLTDGYVQDQGLYIFLRSTLARSFLLAGTVRSASLLQSTCQNMNYETDVAHNVDNLFHQAALQTAVHYTDSNLPDFVHVQLHGMAETSCPGVSVYIMPGVTITSYNEYFNDLYDALVEQSYIDGHKWNITTWKRGAYCNLSGSTNVQGRVFNAIPNISIDYKNGNHICTENVAKPKGTFIHIEQKKKVRDAIDTWVRAIELAWA